MKLLALAVAFAVGADGQDYGLVESITGFHGDYIDQIKIKYRQGGYLHAYAFGTERSHNSGGQPFSYYGGKRDVPQIDYSNQIRCDSGNPALTIGCPLDSTVCTVPPNFYVQKVDFFSDDEYFGLGFNFTFLPIPEYGTGPAEWCVIEGDLGIASTPAKPNESPPYPGYPTPTRSYEANVPTAAGTLGQITEWNVERILRDQGQENYFFLQDVKTEDVVPTPEPSSRPSPQPTPLALGAPKDPITGIYGYAGSRGNQASFVRDACIDQLMYVRGGYDIQPTGFGGLKTTSLVSCNDLYNGCGQNPGQRSATYWNPALVPSNQQFCRPAEDSYGGRYPRGIHSCPVSPEGNQFNRPLGPLSDGTMAFSSSIGFVSWETEYVSSIVQYGSGGFCAANTYQGGLSFQLRDMLTGQETRVINIWSTRVDVNDELKRLEVDCASGQRIVGMSFNGGSLYTIDVDAIRDDQGVAAPPLCTNMPTASPSSGPTRGPSPSPSKGPTPDPSPVPAPAPTSIPAPAPTFAPSPSPTTTCTGVCTETKDAVDALEAQLDALLDAKFAALEASMIARFNAQDKQIKHIKRKVRQTWDAVVPAPTAGPTPAPTATP